MTAQEIALASLDYKRVLVRVGVPLTEQTRRALNGQTEYLCALAQIKDNTAPCVLAHRAGDSA